MSILSVDLQVSNVPAVDYPQMGSDMSNGAIINESNQYEYTTRYNRTEGEMVATGLDAKFFMLDSNEDGTGKLTISKTFDDAVTEQEALIWLNGLSTISLVDLEEFKTFNVEVLEVGEYDYM